MKSSKLYGGFTATYEAVKDVPSPYSCFDSVELGLDRNGSELASFDFPLPYPNNAKCSWVITAPIGHVVRLEFHSFALQESRGCQADYVEVKEGFGEARPTFIARFCGKSLPLAVQSKYPKMYVDFVSDILERYPGFHAKYYFVPDPAVGPCNRDGVDNFIPLSGATGQIFSPRYPRLPAPRNISCTWIITVPQGQFVKLRVNRLKQDSGCSLLSVRDGRDLSSPLVKSFCEWDIFWLPRSYFSSGRYLLVHFYSPSLYWWFEAEFKAINYCKPPS
ncbi:PREDICTED: tolloid-like protein 2 [Acropora digitifera]|uniref:tolloid-like protein 2 n=1 Tax=Acropora digitifera TaxID=70779 RepID=UPI00077A86B0|nr:PREDICTED: tolloid-like protein 2 [Acropora digitifera]